ncbi:sensor histidine kinase [Brevirhabdus sp.]|uniref:sensor histidine kinase n=1 Tax=Brevirhabdus sp. TaxID=2004514 RepID=UPI004058E57A
MALLSVALLPLGLIAVMQTRALTNEIQTRSQLSLIALTRNAAAEERQLIQRAFGAARVLSEMIDLIADEPGTCTAYLSRYLDSEDGYTFVGYIPSDGRITCSSDGVEYDLSEQTDFKEMMVSAQPKVTISRLQPLTAPETATSRTSISVNFPVVRNAVLLGYVTISLPHSQLSLAGAEVREEQPIELFTMNAAGDILTADGGVSDVSERLPANRSLSAFGGGPGAAFVARNGAGQERVFAVVPIVSDTVYAIGSWDSRLPETAGIPVRISPALFPILMWLVSLGVSYFAVHWLVIRHVRSLRLRMRAFAQTRHILSPSTGTGMPAELLEMEDAFIQMTDTILRDEAGLENAVHEQRVLLKEVYHRVKNNLQLIASIMNMQMRQLHSPEAKAVLKRVQDRVLGLATVHRNLYQTDTLSEVRGDLLLHEVINQLVVVALPPDSGVEVTVRLDEFEVYPDQAVPLSLLATEAATNALKYLGRPEHGAPWMRINLTMSEDSTVCLTIANSKGEPVSTSNPAESSGLGSRLIKAFGQQLLGDVEVKETETEYTVTLRFRVSDFEVEERSLKRA